MLSAENLLTLRESLPKPIHTLYIAASLFDEIMETFETGQPGLGSIRIFPTAFLPRDIMVGYRGNNEPVVITFRKQGE